MKKSEIYRKLQRIVLEDGGMMRTGERLLTTDERLEVLRVLFAQEDYALYAEGLEEQLAQEEPRCEREESEV